jgi:hypothetical protein
MNRHFAVDEIIADLLFLFHPKRVEVVAFFSIAVLVMGIQDYYSRGK